MHGLRDGAGRPRVSLAAGQSMVCATVRGGPGSLPQRSSFPLPLGFPEAPALLGSTASPSLSLPSVVPSPPLTLTLPTSLTGAMITLCPPRPSRIISHLKVLNSTWDCISHPKAPKRQPWSGPLSCLGFMAAPWLDGSRPKCTQLQKQTVTTS